MSNLLIYNARVAIFRMASAGFESAREWQVQLQRYFYQTVISRLHMYYCQLLLKIQMYIHIFEDYQQLVYNYALHLYMYCNKAINNYVKRHN